MTAARNPLTAKAIFAQHRRLASAAFLDAVFTFISSQKDGVDIATIAKTFAVSSSRAWQAVRPLLDMRAIRSNTLARDGSRGRPRCVFYSNKIPRKNPLDAASKKRKVKA